MNRKVTFYLRNKAYTEAQSTILSSTVYNLGLQKPFSLRKSSPVITDCSQVSATRREENR